MDEADLINRFTDKPSVSNKRVQQIDVLSRLLLDVASTLNRMLPDGREKSLAITKLEECNFWTIKALEKRPEGENPWAEQ